MFFNLFLEESSKMCYGRKVFESHDQHLVIWRAKRVEMLSVLKYGTFFYRTMQTIYKTNAQAIPTHL